MLTENYGLLDPCTAAYADKIARLFDGAEKRVRKIGVELK
jgi:hypothetical protein